MKKNDEKREVNRQLKCEIRMIAVRWRVIFLLIKLQNGVQLEFCVFKSKTNF